MANINLFQIFNDKKRRFGVGDSTNFRESFIEAVNAASADFNALVFDAETLPYFDSFDDIIDTRLTDFTTITFDSDFNTQVGEREFWGLELHLERLSDTNGLNITIADDNSDVVVSILNGVLSFNGDAINSSITLPDQDTYKIYVGSGASGNYIYIDDQTTTATFESLGLDEVPDLDWVPDLDLIPGYTVGDASTPQEIGVVSSHVISGISGYELKEYKFYSAATLVEWFELNDNSATVTGEVNAFTGTVVGGVWATLYIEPQSSLNKKYATAFGFALDYHLQNGGQWAIEPEAEREKQWYGRGVRMARHIYNTGQTHQNYLGIS